MLFESTGRNTRHHVALCYLEGKVNHSANMGGALSNFFQSGSALLSAGNHRGVSEHTRSKVRIIFDALRANPRVTVQRLEGLLSQIPKVSHVRSFVQSFVRNFVILLFFLKLRKIRLTRSPCCVYKCDRYLSHSDMLYLTPTPTTKVKSIRR